MAQRPSGRAIRIHQFFHIQQDRPETRLVLYQGYDSGTAKAGEHQQAARGGAQSAAIRTQLMLGLCQRRTDGASAARRTADAQIAFKIRTARGADDQDSVTSGDRKCEDYVRTQTALSSRVAGK